MRAEGKGSRRNVLDVKLKANFYSLCSQCSLWWIRTNSAAACLPSLLTSPAFKPMQIAADRRGGRVSAF
jgi:hypothetical protein